jgi:hypothetical protein
MRRPHNGILHLFLNSYVDWFWNPVRHQNPQVFNSLTQHAAVFV